MRNGRAWAVSAAGFGVAVAVAVALAAVEMLTGFNLFGFSLWLVVPAGAFLSGIAASAGFYYASLYFHTKATWLVAAQMVAAAALSNLLIYFLEYWFMEVDGKVVHYYVSFSKYMDIFLTHQEFRAGRAMANMGEMGQAGYWFALLQFAAFLAGGLTLFILLRQRRTCRTCPDSYLHFRAQRDRYFQGPDEASQYYDGLFEHPFASLEFMRQSATGSTSAISRAGAVHVHSAVLECPACTRQIWTDEVKQSNGKRWKELPQLTRAKEAPIGTNIVAILKASPLA